MVVLKTTNGGASWPTRSFPATGGYGTSCEAIAVAAGAPAIVYAGGQKDDEVKIFRSADSGSTWEDITGNLAAMHSTRDTFHAIWVNPYDQETVAVGTSKGVFRCTIDGTNQTRIWNVTEIDHRTYDFAYDQATGTAYAATYRGVFWPRWPPAMT